MSDTATSEPTSRKRPWLAALLAFVYPGLGHVYLRMWGRALLWFGTVILSSLLLVPDGAVPETLSFEAFTTASEQLPVTAVAALLAVTALSVIDAYWMASRHNDDAKPATEADADTRTCPECGEELDADLDFCHWCTARLENPATNDQ